MAIALTLALVAAGAALPPALAGFRARTGLPSGSAEWIWAERDVRNPYPLAFYAVRDFTIHDPLPGARLLAAAEPEMVLTLNGVRVAAGGRSVGGTRLDAYEVGSLLHVGSNRLVAELRSPDGEGGFLARLVAEPGGETLLVTDGSWRIFDRQQVGLVQGWHPLGREGSMPRVWGFPPVGRWGRPRPGANRPLFAALTGSELPVPGSRSEKPRDAETLSTGRPGYVVLDWGEEVAGYLALEIGTEPGLPPQRALPPQGAMQLALLSVSDSLPKPLLEPSTPTVDVLFMPGKREWLATRPRRFRYALVMGLERPLTGRVYPLAAADRDSLLAESATLDQPPEGVFNIEPPRSHTPTEDEVRRALDALGARRHRLAASR